MKPASWKSGTSPPIVLRRRTQGIITNFASRWLYKWMDMDENGRFQKEKPKIFIYFHSISIDFQCLSN